MKTTTIEERAKKYENTEHHLRNYSKGMLYSCYKGYVQGATEQREIDIEKACEWLKEHLGTDLLLVNHNMIEEFKKAMEEE